MNELSPMLGLTARDRRTLALGLAGVSAVLALGRGIPAWQRWERTAHTTAEDRVGAAASAVAAASSLHAVRDSAAVRTLRLARWRDSLISAATVAETGAALAGVLSDLMDTQAVNVLAISVRSGKASIASLQPVGARLSLVADFQGLVHILRTLETEPLLLAVRELSVEQVARPADSLGDELRIELLVEGLVFVADQRHGVELPPPRTAVTR